MVERSLHKAMVVGPSPTPATVISMDTKCIGVLDSGVGGLTVLKEIVFELPHESIIYIGDSLYAPYGDKTSQEILALAKKLIVFLLQKNVKLIVIACNTITVNGIEKLREIFPQIPIVGTVPVVKTAAQITKNKKVGLLVTGATALSSYNTKLLQEFTKDCEVTIVGTNKLVPLIEAQQYEELEEIIQEELQPFHDESVDTIILGSTHFPVIRKQIAKFFSSKVILLDSGGAVARQGKRILENNKILAPKSYKPHYAFYTTGERTSFTTIAKNILEIEDLSVNHIVLQ